MIVRSARGVDWPKLLELIKQAHARSNIAAYALDEKFTKDLCLSVMISQRKVAHDEGAHIFVAELEGELHGFVIAAAQRLYVFGRDLIVSDLMFYTREGAHASAAGMLWDAVEAWAAPVSVVSIRPGVTNAIGDPERTAKFFEARGYERMGLMLEKRRAAVAARRVA